MTLESITKFSKTSQGVTRYRYNLKQARVVQKLDNAIHWINHFPAASVVCFVNIYPLNSDLSGG